MNSKEQATQYAEFCEIFNADVKKDVIEIHFLAGYGASEKNAEQERIKYALEVLKEVNLPYADNELLGRRVKNKINFLQKQLK